VEMRWGVKENTGERAANLEQFVVATSQSSSVAFMNGGLIAALQKANPCDEPRSRVVS